MEKFAEKFALSTKKPVFVTGAAGFIGFHLSEFLLRSGYEVVGYDSVNDYYDVALKRARLAILQGYGGFRFFEADLCDRESLRSAMAESAPNYVVHLAAQAGVRYSLKNPRAYVRSNIEGFVNVLEACRENKKNELRHLLYASSSSVYGECGDSATALAATGGFSEVSPTDSPMSFYGATKKSGEVMAYCYSRLYEIRATGLRFFTAYGEWGRPDMALHLFTRAILSGEPLRLFNGGRMSRDFTYIADVIESVRRVLCCPPTADENGVHHAIYNVGAGSPHDLHEFIRLLENAIGKKAEIHCDARQPGELLNTYANCDALFRLIDYRPETSLAEGIGQFYRWYESYYGAF